MEKKMGWYNKHKHTRKKLVKAVNFVMFHEWIPSHSHECLPYSRKVVKKIVNV